jgi:ATP-dependent Clp protease adapter protein ClpS
VDDYITHNLIILDDDLHSFQHFATAIKTVFPTLPDKAIRCMCALIHKAGSATCARGNPERLEISKEALERFNVKCFIERRTV